MSKILVTGMSAPQASQKANSRGLSFTKVVVDALSELGHEVHWSLPSLDWTEEDLSLFDSVVVGVSPLTSLSANYSYGGLHAIGELKDSDKLTLLIDAPQVAQIGAGLRAVRSNPDSLTKAFYSNRPGYQRVTDSSVSKRLLATAEWLLDEQWPTTIYPELPWKDSDSTEQLLPSGAKGALVGINRDIALIEKDLLTARREKWVVDSYTTPWAKSTVKTISLPTAPMKWHKGCDDVMVQTQIARSIGALITPYRQDGTWWSYRYAQALSAYTPIATGWQESGKLHDSWSFLAATIESASQNIRDGISIEQRESYVAAIPSIIETNKKLQDTLKITKRKVIL